MRQKRESKTERSKGETGAGEKYEEEQEDVKKERSGEECDTRERERCMCTQEGRGGAFFHGE